MRNITNEDAERAYNTAPEAIQDALSEGSLIDFIVGLEKNYGLHIDVVGQVSGMIRNTLLGLMDPSEFFAGLLELGINSETAKKLTNDLNAQVFIPLHKEIVGNTSVETSHAQVPSYAPTNTPPVSKLASPIATRVATPSAMPQKIPTPTYMMPPTSPAPAPTQFQPVVPQAAPISAPQPDPINTVRPPSVADANREALGKIMKEYGVDPYREPVDEK